MIRSEPLGCREIVELVTDYLEGSMPAERRLGFEEHVAICPPCRNYFDQFRHTVELGKKIEEDELPANVRYALVEAFRDWRKDIR
ncbi:MAG: zf-HC2 domain-containing protein [Actinomycetota bacterium]|nr:zf-HC2 domain-containing protein [Actinomycetota bacterium]